MFQICNKNTGEIAIVYKIIESLSRLNPKDVYAIIFTEHGGWDTVRLNDGWTPMIGTIENINVLESGKSYIKNGVCNENFSELEDDDYLSRGFIPAESNSIW